MSVVKPTPKNTKVITPANHNKHKLPNEPIGIQSKYIYRCHAWENVCGKHTIAFGFYFDWLRKWHELFKPITERNKAKPNQTRIRMTLTLN